VTSITHNAEQFGDLQCLYGLAIRAPGAIVVHRHDDTATHVSQGPVMSAVAHIDSTVDVVTPENIAFHYNVAGPFRRLPAFLLDVLIRASVFFSMFIALMVAFSFANMAGVAFATVLILWFLLDWFYGGVFEALFNGQTPGKWVVGIRVLSVNGQPINGIQAVLRNILRSLDMFPLISLEALGIDEPMYLIPTFMLSLVAMSLNSRFQRIGDLVAGTMVVVEERRWLTGVARLENPRIPQLASYIPADYPISRSLARSLAAYVERRRFFSTPRRREVAGHLAEPLLARFGFPTDTSYDLLLCALYYRAFIADRGGEERVSAEIGNSPFGDNAATAPSEPIEAVAADTP
jgi:uncharacterized RDD family membrane protein YckC